jgi:hypothetical protein
MNHTEGRLTALGPEIYRDDGTQVCFIEPVFPFEECAADASRLVACWNYCDQIETDYLEVSSATEDFDRKQNALFSQSERIKKVQKERDEALDVLRMVGGDIATTLYRLDKETEARVNAILAKHQKVNHEE